MRDYYFDEQTYQSVLSDIINGIEKNTALQKNHAVLFLGAQPGAGKSTFCNMDNNFTDYIVINGDNYRKNHPFYNEIVLHNKENMAELTQSFVNSVVEDLIKELSKEGYNLIIEGTLRDANVPISTCSMLREQGYRTELYVIGCSACESWESTISRAELMAEIEYIPRLVPIDKYNLIVNSIVENLEKIETSGCMDRIVVLSRDSKVLWKGDTENGDDNASVALSKVLNVLEWNRKFEMYRNEYELLVEKFKEGNGTRIVRNRRGGR